jgi:hypothetical protein
VGPWDKCTMHIYGDISIHFIIQRVEGHWMIGNDSCRKRKEGEQDASLCNLHLEPVIISWYWSALSPAQASFRQLSFLGQPSPRAKMVLIACIILQLTNLDGSAVNN